MRQSVVEDCLNGAHHVADHGEERSLSFASAARGGILGLSGSRWLGVRVLIDHLIFAHPDLDAAVAGLKRRLGVEATGGGRHPGRGTHNKLLGLGPTTYLELIAPDPNQPAPATPRPYGVEGVTHGGLVGWAIAVDDIEHARANALSLGFDPGPIIEGRREDAAGRLLHWRVTANAQIGGVIPFLISWGATPHPAVAAPSGLSLISVWVEHPQPTEVERALAALEVDVDVRRGHRPALVARIESPLGNKELR